MKSSLIASAAIASALAALAVPPAQAQGAGKEKCYGIAQPGSNDCANISGSHSCAGQARNANTPEEWNYVPKGSCLKMGGMSAEDAKAAMVKAP